MGIDLITSNKKAYFNYEILQIYEAGLELFGPEVKSIRNHDISINEAFIIIRKGEAFLINSNIKKYEFANFVQGVDPFRTRKLLLHKKEIKKILSRVQLESLTIVPLKLYFNGNYIKLEIGLGRGKKLHDKRETIKKRDSERKEMRKYKY
ncbi:SsrA-binding protein SmpB [Mesoplasma corruscae]|uniref:SsrA-binding protein n=1 Tax=Mesoplasma corruscae TaxID=216874 RepID=A0A2S5RGP2_9MOLU|nr:SsrA-binding protein SmpB [Mesoplasma corruscae]PPE06461.1 SsrA-binding protein [Mesoplasma corruscae]